MPRRRQSEDESPARPTRKARPARGSRLALYVLVTAGLTIAARATVATVIPVHGDGMAPTLRDGDVVLMTRGAFRVAPGDLVVYAPRSVTIPEPSVTPPADPSGTDTPRGQYNDATTDRRPFPNAAVFDQRDLSEHVDSQWSRVQRRSGAKDTPAPTSTLQLGRVLAKPGDRVTFGVPDAALGIAVNGVPLRHKASAPRRMVLPPPPAPGEDARAVNAPTIRATAYETLGALRYPVLVSAEGPQSFEPLAHMTPAGGPALRHAVVAPGYLILADNRPEGACCDSRALGWIDPAALHGEVVARLSGAPSGAPDADPAARGPRWLP